MTKQKLKKYQEKKFEYYKDYNQVIYNDNEAYITLKVDKIDKVISSYSLPGEEILNQEFINLIEKKASFIPMDAPLVLEIHNNTLSAEEKILVRKLIKRYFDLERTDKEIELKSLRRKSFFFLIIGIICFTLSITLSYLGQLKGIYEIISFLGSFSIWEFFELQLFEQDDLKEEIIKFDYYSKIRVVFDKL